MSRIRTLKPEWLDDERISLASDRARVLSLGLILLADDYGNGRASPRYIGSRVFVGLGAEAGPAAEAALAELEDIGYVVLYESDGQRYFSIRNWAKHQRVDKPGKPLVPAPPDKANSLVRTKGDRTAYFMRSVATGLIKIGESCDPVGRMVQITAQSADVLELLAVGGVERDLHRELAAWRVHGEWFQPSAEVLSKARAHGFTGRPIATSRSNGPSGEHSNPGPVNRQPPTIGAADPDTAQPLDSTGDPPDSPNPSESQRIPANPSADRDLDLDQDLDRYQDQDARDPGPVGPGHSSDVRDLFETFLVGWRRNHTGEEPKLTDARRKRIRDRLKDHPFSQLVEAMQGVWLSRWHVDNGQATLESAMRDAASVERFAAEYRKKHPLPKPRKARAIEVPTLPPDPAANAAAARALTANLAAAFAPPPEKP